MGSHTAPADHLTLHLQIHPQPHTAFTDDCVWDLTLHLQITLHCTCRSTPSSNGDFTDCCSDSSHCIPSLRANIWQSKCWQIYPLHQTAIIDSYSETSYLADQVLADLTPKMPIIDSYSESSYSAEQVLADLSPHIKQQL